MFAAPPVIETEVFTRLPDELRWTRDTAWSDRRGGGPLHSFLEGPSFDRAGNLYIVDIPHGRIFRLSPKGDWTLFAHYDGNPNGLKIHRDGRIFVADNKIGLLIFDSVNGKLMRRIEGPKGSAFAGLNDLFFADDGTLYLTDPGGSAMDVPTGKIYRWREGGEAELVLDGLAYPNGLILESHGRSLLVAISRTLQVIRAPIHKDRAKSEKTGIFIQMSGGLAGPDGMAMDAEGGFVVCNSGLASAWHFDRLGEPIGRIKSCAGVRVTNCAYGGEDGRTLYFTESEEGVIMRARMKTPGRKMFSHM